MPIAKEILNMLDLGRKAIASNFTCFFTSKIQKSQRISVPTVQWLWIIPLDGYRGLHRNESSLCRYTPSVILISADIMIDTTGQNLHFQPW